MATNITSDIADGLDAVRSELFGDDARLIPLNLQTNPADSRGYSQVLDALSQPVEIKTGWMLEEMSLQQRKASGDEQARMTLSIADVGQMTNDQFRSVAAFGLYAAHLNVPVNTFLVLEIRPDRHESIDGMLRMWSYSVKFTGEQFP